jgi:hypothetical protein
MIAGRNVHHAKPWVHKVSILLLAFCTHMEGFITALHQISGCHGIISLYHKQFQIEMQLFYVLRDTEEIESLRETIQSPNHPELWALAFKSGALISVHAYRPAKYLPSGLMKAHLYVAAMKMLSQSESECYVSLCTSMYIRCK